MEMKKINLKQKKYISQGIGYLFISIIFLIVLVFYTFKAILDTKWRLEFIELLVLLILFSQLPPLVSFAIYFCGFDCLCFLL